MEPLSARGLPRLSWIDTLYSSTYLSILLFTPLDTLLPIYLHSRLHLMPFYPATPSFSVSWAACSCYKQSYIHTESTAFSLDFQLVGITVAVHNNTVNPQHTTPPTRLFHKVVITGLLLASRHRDRVKPGETWYGECESCSQPGGRTLCSNLSRTQAVGC